jgi:ketosteroid isomerase-like protein
MQIGLLDERARRHREIIIRAYEAQIARDWETFYSVFDPDMEFVEADSLPYGGTYRGLDAFREGNALMLSHWAPFNTEIEEITVGGDLACIHWHITGAARATGTPVDFPLISLWRFRNEKVIELRPFYFDTAMICRALGVSAA